MIDGLNDILAAVIGPFGFEGVQHVCFDPPLKALEGRCQYGSLSKDNLNAALGCSPLTTTPAKDRCFYARQQDVCLHEGNRYKRYQDLFRVPDADELQNQFREIVGDSYELLPPTMLAAFQSVSRAAVDSSGLVNPEAAQLCDGSLWDSMDLDQVRSRSPSPFPQPTPA